MITLETVRPGVVVEVDPDGAPGVVVIGGKLTAGQRSYLVERLEGRDVIATAGQRALAHRWARVVIRCNRRELGRHFPSAQSLADYTVGALARYTGPLEVLDA